MTRPPAATAHPPGALIPAPSRSSPPVTRASLRERAVLTWSKGEEASRVTTERRRSSVPSTAAGQASTPPRPGQPETRDGTWLCGVRAQQERHGHGGPDRPPGPHRPPSATRSSAAAPVRRSTRRPCGNASHNSRSGEVNSSYESTRAA
ncbi:hypothetical protein ABZY14_06155 [Streptomyces sp. NPDC006617]|uniref:hypothetical protein n=1 Tax=Streptomyces sp. NPDC006617 TaxID=3155354 RepID=UPI0033BE4C2E